jgi:hypothetical protein
MFRHVEGRNKGDRRNERKLTFQIAGRDGTLEITARPSK